MIREYVGALSFGGEVPPINIDDEERPPEAIRKAWEQMRQVLPIGSALGTLGGVLTIAALTTAMEFQSVHAYIQQVVAGLILILLVVLDRTVRPGPRTHAAAGASG